MQNSYNQVENKFSNFVPNIMVFGVGGAGINAVNNMILSKLEKVKFVVGNTDCQSLGYSLAPQKIQFGIESTRGLGAGAKPEVGQKACEEVENEIRECLKGVDMIFVAAGMGGGTGTGAAPVVARIAKEMGILTVGVVTKPFSFEGPNRTKIAESGIDLLEKEVDTLIVVANQNLLRLANNKTSFAESFKMADNVLFNAVRCVVELLTKPGFINRDFADLKTIIYSMGRAMIGYSEATGEHRSVIAVENAITNPILENGSINGATSLLINITGGIDMGMLEVEAITEHIRNHANENANVIFGTAFDDEMDGSIRVSIIATGMPLDSTIQESNIKTENEILNVMNEIQNRENELKSNRNKEEDSFFEEEIINEDNLKNFTFNEMPKQQEIKNSIDELSSISIEIRPKISTESKKKSQFLTSSDKMMPLFSAGVSKVCDKFFSIGKNIMQEREEMIKKEEIKISDWKNEHNIEDLGNDDSWENFEITKKVA